MHCPGRKAKAEGAADFGKLADDAAAKKSFRRRVKGKLDKRGGAEALFNAWD
jgi:hypothetical protein